MFGSVFSICFTVISMFFSLAFKIAEKLRLTLPLLYVVVASVSLFFTDWTTKNEKLVVIGFFVTPGLSVLSWVSSFVLFLRRRKHERNVERLLALQIELSQKMEIPLSNFTVDEDGNMCNPQAGSPFMNF